MHGFLELMERSSIGIDPNHNVIHLDDGAAGPGRGRLEKLAGYRGASARLAKLQYKKRSILIVSSDYSIPTWTQLFKAIAS